MRPVTGDAQSSSAERVPGESDKKISINGYPSGPPDCLANIVVYSDCLQKGLPLFLQLRQVVPEDLYTGGIQYFLGALGVPPLGCLPLLDYPRVLEETVVIHHLLVLLVAVSGTQRRDNKEPAKVMV